MANSEHNNKHFVIEKGKAICDKGTSFPNFKVTSHKKHYWNDADGTEDYLAVTEDDLQFNPIAIPFGNCSMKNGNPCAFAPVGKWQKPYDKVKVMGKSCLTEISELQCAVGGKIIVMNHGQTAEITKQNVKNADAELLQHINPFFDFREFLDDLEMGEVSDLESEKISTDTEKKINKVNLFMVDDTPINENTILEYNQTIKVKVYTQNMPKELLKLILYEEDFNGDGESKKVAEITKPTNDKGFLWHEFNLETDFKNIANAMMEGKQEQVHEYSLSVESVKYSKKETIKNIEIVKPNFLKIQPDKPEKIEEIVIEDFIVKGKYKKQMGYYPVPKTGRSVSIVQEIKYPVEEKEKQNNDEDSQNSWVINWVPNQRGSFGIYRLAKSDDTQRGLNHWSIYAHGISGGGFQIRYKNGGDNDVFSAKQILKEVIRISTTFETKLNSQEAITMKFVVCNERRNASDEGLIKTVKKLTTLHPNITAEVATGLVVVEYSSSSAELKGVWDRYATPDSEGRKGSYLTIKNGSIINIDTSIGLKPSTPQERQENSEAKEKEYDNPNDDFTDVDKEWKTKNKTK